MDRRCFGSALLGLLALGAASSVQAEVGEARQAVLDGESATFDQVRATVALVEADSGFPFCTGVLVAPDVVLTAAHCALVIENGTPTGARAPESLLVVAGATRLSAAPERDVFEVAHLAAHPDFLRDPPEDEATQFGALHDIAVLSLARAVDTISPVSVLSANDAAQLMPVGTQLVIEGYGSADSAGKFGGGILRLADVPLVRLGHDEFIAGETGTPDTCPGDSGGPVYLQRNGTLALVGLTSRAIAGATSACGEGGIYTLVSAYTDFIAEVAPSPVSQTSMVSAPSANGGDYETSTEGVTAAEGTEQASSDEPQSMRAGTVRAAGCSTGSFTPAAGGPAMAMTLYLLAVAVRRRRR